MKGRVLRLGVFVLPLVYAATPCRGGPVIVEFFDDLETLVTSPSSLPGQRSSPLWINHPVDDTTRNHWDGQISAFCGVSTADAGGNASNKVRLIANTGQPPDQFFTGWRNEFVRSVNAPYELHRLTFAPDPAHVVRVSHEVWNDSDASLWSSEALRHETGQVVSRVVWGGACVDDCESRGFPTGPIDRLYYLDEHPDEPAGRFVQCTYIGAAPAGFDPGDPVPVPTQTWHRVVHEVDGSNTLRVYIDYLDGQGEFQIMEAPVWTTHLIDAVGGNASYETQGATHYTDNIHAIGTALAAPDAPDLACDVTGVRGVGGYTDDLDWLVPGPLSLQHPRWTDFASSQASVTVVGSSNKIVQTNTLADYHHRTEFRTNLPSAFAFDGSPLRVCVDAHVSANNKTVRAIALRATESVPAFTSDVVARLYIGSSNPDLQNPFYQPRLYAQINPSFVPFIPAGNDPTDTIYFPVVGTDIVDIGPFASGGADKRICVEIDDFANLGVTLDGAPVGTGLRTFRGLRNAGRLDFESRNNGDGASDEFRIDNVSVECAALPLVVYPDLSLVYLDDFENYVSGAPIGPQSDDADNATPNRWSSTHAAVVRDLGDKSYVLEMENATRVNLPGTPSVTSSGVIRQATTTIPRIDHEKGVRGWVVSGRFKLTDGATTRYWIPGHRFNSLDRQAAALVYSAFTGTFWTHGYDPDAQGPPNFGSKWINTGRTPASLGVGFNEWFRVSIHLNLDGKITYRINDTLLREANGAIIHGQPLRHSASGGMTIPNTALDRMYFSSGEERTAPVGSILYADDIRAWSLPCPGDANSDGRVDMEDFLVTLNQYGSSGVDAPGNIAPDADGDGVPDDDVVNFTDFTEVLSNYGNECD